MAYERKNIHAMAAYVPGEQIDAPGIIKLNTNENPYPPSPAVSQALADCDVARLRQYPSPTARKLRDAIAARHGLSAENVIVTNGGDELLRMAIATFVETLSVTEWDKTNTGVGAWRTVTIPVPPLHSAEFQASRGHVILVKFHLIP